jgi:hypothetical protein
VAQLSRKIAAFNGTGASVTVFTRARCYSLLSDESSLHRLISFLEISSSHVCLSVSGESLTKTALFDIELWSEFVNGSCRKWELVEWYHWGQHYMHRISSGLVATLKGQKSVIFWVVAPCISYITYVLKERNVSIFKAWWWAKQESGNKQVPSGVWRWYVPAKRHCGSGELHGVTTQRITAVIISHPREEHLKWLGM